MPDNIVGRSLGGLALLLGFGATAWGLAHLQWPRVLPWAGIQALVHYLIFVVCSFVMVAVGTRIFRLHAIALGGILAAAIAILSGSTWPLLMGLWFFAAATVVGNFVLGRIGISPKGGYVTPFLVGAALYGTAVGLLAHWPLGYPGVYGAALALPLLLGRKHLDAIVRQTLEMFRPSPGDPPRFDLLGTMIATVGLFYFTIALMPEVSFDALAFHLLVAGHMAARHQWGFDPSLYSLALIPKLGDWLYSIGNVLAGETGVRLINLAFTYCLAWQTREAVLWAGGNEKGAKWAALLMLSTPLTLTETASLHVEAIWSTFILAGSMALFRLLFDESEPAQPRLKLAGLLLGFATSVKAITLCFLPALTAVLAISYRRWAKKPLLWSAIVGLILFFAVGSIPYLTAWLIAGNPVYPFFNAIFKSPYYPAINFNNPLFNSGITWDLIYRITFDSGKYLEASNGAAGFQWLLLLPAAIVYLIIERSNRALLLLLATIVSIAIVFQSQSYLRYVFPAVPLLSAVIGVALSEARAQWKICTRLLFFAAAIAIALNGLFITSGIWSYRNIPFGILLSRVDRDRYLDKRMPIRRAVKLVNLINPGQSPVAFFSQPFAAGLEGDALYPDWYNYKFQTAIANARTPADIAHSLGAYGATLVVLDSHWGSPEKRELITDATRLISRFGPISVRSLKDKYLYLRELLKNPKLNGTIGWTMSTKARQNARKSTFFVTVNAPASQAVQVHAGGHYMNTVRSRCKDPGAEGRVQVNWLDRHGDFIGASIQPFACTANWSMHSQKVIAPSSATTAIVYATAHTDLAVEIDSVSFRGN